MTPAWWAGTRTNIAWNLFLNAQNIASVICARRWPQKCRGKRVFVRDVSCRIWYQSPNSNTVIYVHFDLCAPAYSIRCMKLLYDCETNQTIQKLFHMDVQRFAEYPGTAIYVSLDSRQCYVMYVFDLAQGFPVLPWEVVRYIMTGSCWIFHLHGFPSIGKGIRIVASQTSLGTPSAHNTGRNLSPMDEMTVYLSSSSLSRAL